MAKILNLFEIEADTAYSRQDVIDAALKHLEYSFADVETYDELTPKEKEIFSKEMFNAITGIE